MAAAVREAVGKVVAVTVVAGEVGEVTVEEEMEVVEVARAAAETAAETVAEAKVAAKVAAEKEVEEMEQKSGKRVAPQPS